MNNFVAAMGSLLELSPAPTRRYRLKSRLAGRPALELYCHGYSVFGESLARAIREYTVQHESDLGTPIGKALRKSRDDMARSSYSMRDIHRERARQIVEIARRNNTCDRAEAAQGKLGSITTPSRVARALDRGLSQQLIRALVRAQENHGRKTSR